MTFELEAELLRFPKAKHDDLMDTLASQLEIMYAPMKKGPSRKKRKEPRGNFSKW